MQPTNELYYKYAGMITAVARKYSRQCPDLADDLFLQAQYMFCKACLSYDPENPAKASFDTWLYRQLQSITGIIRSESHGATHANIGSHSAVAFSALVNECPERSNCRDQDDCPNMEKTITRLLTDGYVDDYNGQLALEDEYPKEMKPYFEALRGDALRVFRDYCNGCFDKEVSRSKYTRAQRNAMLTLTPRKMYLRHYAKYGWSIRRVSEAVRTLRGVLHAYMLGKLPSITENPEFSAVSDSTDLFGVCNA